MLFVKRLKTAIAFKVNRSELFNFLFVLTGVEVNNGFFFLFNQGFRFVIPWEEELDPEWEHC